METLKGRVFDVQGFSVHDGPGCRTLVFLKGCPLRCRWCSNPEGINPYRQLMYYENRCAHHYACRSACKKGAVAVGPTGEVRINRTVCADCLDFACAAACNYDALKISGYDITADELMKKIQRDRQYWGPGGGVTLSGGEPMLQYVFAGAVLKRCYNAYIHTAVETCGHAPLEHFEKVLPYLEWVFLDLKHMDPDTHRDWTGASNVRILENAKRIARAESCRLIFRMPLVPGFNDSDRNVAATAEFVRGVDKDEINILPLHHLGSSKYNLLGQAYECEMKTPGMDRVAEIAAMFAERGIRCYAGSDTPF